MSNWQDISTAPRDGSEVLGWREDCGIMLIRYMAMYDFMTETEIGDCEDESASQNDWWAADFVTGCRLEGTEVPTHWQPLPEPPKEGK